MNGILFCSLWPYLAGAFGGWLLSSILTRRLWVLPQKVLSLSSERDRLLLREPGEKIVEKRVEIKADNPVHLARIQALESELSLAAELRSRIATLEARTPNIVERLVERPIEKVVEKRVEVRVDNPALVSRISTLEAENSIIPKLRSQIWELEAKTPKVVEKIVEKPVEKIVQIQDHSALAALQLEVANWRTRYAALEERLGRMTDRVEPKKILARPLEIDVNAARMAGFNLNGGEDLRIIEGIGPKIAELLISNGINTFSELAQASQPQLRGILDMAGGRFKLANPGTWPEQASLAAHNKWQELRRLQEELDGGVRYEPPERKAATEINFEAARLAGFNIKPSAELLVIEGIGPKISGILNMAGIYSFSDLAGANEAELKHILVSAGPEFALANPNTWSEQAQLAVGNRWQELKNFQDLLVGGVSFASNS